MMTPGLGATRIRMRSLTGRLVRLAFAAGIVRLCASGIAAARDPAAPYLGMTEAQIIVCAGEPHSRLKSGAKKETLTYHYSGAGPVPAKKPKTEEKKSEEKEPKSIFSKFKKKEDKTWTCSASLVFENDKLVREPSRIRTCAAPINGSTRKILRKRRRCEKKACRLAPSRGHAALRRNNLRFTPQPRTA
jgi:hypothetical protein